MVTCTVYNPPASPHQDDLLEHLITETDQIRAQHPEVGVVILGDPKRLDISDIFSGNGLIQVVDTPTRGQAILDLIITDLKGNYHKPEVISPLGLSDHNMVLWRAEAHQPQNETDIKTVRPMRDSDIRAFGQWLCTYQWKGLHAAPTCEQKTNIFYNILENAMNRYFPTRRQFGSLKGRSTAHYLVSLLYYLSKESDKLGTITTMVMTDFSKAFDKIDHTVALHRASYLGSEISLQTGDNEYGTIVSSQTGKLSCLVPQSTILGPIIFLAVFDDAVRETLSRHDSKPSVLQSELDKFSDWAELSHVLLCNKGTRPVPGQSPVLTRVGRGRVPTLTCIPAGQLQGPWRGIGAILAAPSSVSVHDRSPSESCQGRVRIPLDPAKDLTAARPNCKSRSAPYHTPHGSRRETDRAPVGRRTLGFMTPAGVYTKDMPNGRRFKCDPSITCSRHGLKINSARTKIWLAAVGNPANLRPVTSGTGCGGNLTAPSGGPVTSPNYPGNYGNNENCEWAITVPEGSIIILTFDSFHTEYGYDFLTIYDGANDNAAEIESTSNTMFLRFTSISWTWGSSLGFQFNYTSSTAGQCWDPGVPANGNRDNNSNFTSGQTVRYTCMDGYQLWGTANITCQPNGTWSGATPTCGAAANYAARRDCVWCGSTIHHRAGGTAWIGDDTRLVLGPANSHRAQLPRSDSSRIRLVEYGPWPHGPNEGLVEVRPADSWTWGGVCAKHFDLRNADVVCRMLGYIWANDFGPSLDGQGPAYMADLRCNGNESSLFNCSYAGWGSHDCGEDEGYVDVFCDPRRIRLSGGSGSNEGRVEVRPEDSMTWGTVCHNRFNMDDADVVCRMLGYPNATQKLRHVGTSVNITDGVNVYKQVDSFTYLGITLDPSLRRRDLIVRTPRGTPPVAGIPPGHISYVTDQMNRIKPMPARLLNPAGASRGYIPDGHRRTGPIYMDDLRCDGNETSLFSCSYAGWTIHNCYHGQDAGVVCRTDSSRIRLVEGSGPNQGRVEVRPADSFRWGTVCHNGFDLKDAEVVCRMLGYPNVYVVRPFGKGTTFLYTQEYL
ncbi:scavenger receptor [Branchiostoma belcheri]|nr:scavenger receptor [Branchiostoma belcheri]